MKRLLPLAFAACLWGMAAPWGTAALAQTAGEPTGSQIPPPPAHAPASEAKPVLAEPRDAELLPPAHETRGEVRIEQIRAGNRVARLIVTPAGQTYSYTMQNRDGQRPISPQEIPNMWSGLSIPSFLKFEF
jgi:hypothetical protein